MERRSRSTNLPIVSPGVSLNLWIGPIFPATSFIKFTSIRSRVGWKRAVIGKSLKSGTVSTRKSHQFLPFLFFFFRRFRLSREPIFVAQQPDYDIHMCVCMCVCGFDKTPTRLQPVTLCSCVGPSGAVSLAYFNPDGDPSKLRENIELEIEIYSSITDRNFPGAFVQHFLNSCRDYIRTTLDHIRPSPRKHFGVLGSTLDFV